MSTDPHDLNNFLKTCSYTDFVGTILQTNVPPGAFSTINQWAQNSRLNSSSYVYEVACTTGFSLRELSRLTDCSGEGADISKRSVEGATRAVANSTLGERVRYTVADATTHQPARRPTHIVVGAALGFFPDPERVLTRCAELFEDTGYLLAAPFYTHTDIPDDLVREARSVLGITPTRGRYKEVMWPYRGFQILFENRQRLEMETADELDYYCEATTRRATALLTAQSDSTYAIIHRRLLEIKDLCNRLRPYQAYSVLVLRFLRREYPNRYVELF